MEERNYLFPVPMTPLNPKIPLNLEFFPWRNPFMHKRLVFKVVTFERDECFPK